MRMCLFLMALLCAGPAAAQTGKDLFDQNCASCHSLGRDSSLNGPSLRGVVWRKIASLPDFAYTPALKSAVGTWTPDRLSQFLKNTQGFAPGTSMFFDIQDPDARRAIIKFLETNRASPN